MRQRPAASPRKAAQGGILREAVPLRKTRDTVGYRAGQRALDRHGEPTRNPVADARSEGRQDAPLLQYEGPPNRGRGGPSGRLGEAGEADPGDATRTAVAPYLQAGRLTPRRRAWAGLVESRPRAEAGGSPRDLAAGECCGGPALCLRGECLSAQASRHTSVTSHSQDFPAPTYGAGSGWFLQLACSRQSRSPRDDYASPVRQNEPVPAPSGVIPESAKIRLRSGAFLPYFPPFGCEAPGSNEVSTVCVSHPDNLRICWMGS